MLIDKNTIIVKKILKSKECKISKLERKWTEISLLYAYSMHLYRPMSIRKYRWSRVLWYYHYKKCWNIKEVYLLINYFITCIFFSQNIQKRNLFRIVVFNLLAAIKKSLMLPNDTCMSGTKGPRVQDKTFRLLSSSEMLNILTGRMTWKPRALFSFILFLFSSFMNNIPKIS